jgi:hypothetical protein
MAIALLHYRACGRARLYRLLGDEDQAEGGQSIVSASAMSATRTAKWLQLRCCLNLRVEWWLDAINGYSFAS